MSDWKDDKEKLFNESINGVKEVTVGMLYGDRIESLLSKQRASLIKEFEGVIGDDENVSEAAIKSVNDGGESIIMTNVVETVNRGIRNELRAEQRTKLQAIKRNL